MKLTTCAIWVLWSMAAVLPARLAAESGGYLMIVGPHEQAITGESTDAKHPYRTRG